MTLVRLRERAQITLPQELRAALKVRQGDYFEAEVVDGRLVLEPVSVVSRSAGRKRLMERLDRDRPEAAPSDEALMAEVVDTIKSIRRRNRESGG